jgi:small subunit ribosomal protein S9
VTGEEFVAEDRAIYQGTGKRKTSVARVRLTPGSGAVKINGRDPETYFPRLSDRVLALQALKAAGLDTHFDVIVRLQGGGVTSQAGAMRHGVARALVEADPNLRGELKRAGYLSRDAREVERKKAGLKKARKRPQFSKR